MQIKRIAFAAGALLGLSSLLAASPNKVTYEVNGTLQKITNSGNDCLQADFNGAVVTATIPTTATPVAHTASSATYSLPAGTIQVFVAGSAFTNVHPWTVKITLSSQGDTLEMNGLAYAGPDFGPIAVKSISHLVANSWPASVLQHPRKFAPTPQNLRLPTDTFMYQVEHDSACTATSFSLTGAVSN